MIIADIVGFGNDAVFISLGNVDGTFQNPISSSVPFTKKNGWTNNNDHPRTLADVNGDGRADIVGFGNDAVFISLGNLDGTFQNPISSSVPFIKKNGWTNNNDHPRTLADVNGDGRADIVGFGNDAVFTSFASVAPQGMTLPDNFLNLSNSEQQNYLGINPYSTSYSAQGNKFVSSNGTGATYLWCTDYAYGRAIEKGLFQNNSGIGAQIRGHAGFWDDDTSQYNRAVRQNSIVVWDRWKGGAGSVGHVAFVEKVYADGSFLISESNWGSARMSFNVRHIKPGTNAFDSAKFIYL